MSFRLVLTAVLSIAVLAVFVSLGTWQLQRLHWKQGVLAEIDARIGADPVALPVQPDPEVDRFLPVIATGEIGAKELHVLVSSRDYGAGFRIIAPFTVGGRRVLLDRGFVLASDKATARVAGAVDITGNLHWPDERDSYTPPNEPEKNYYYAREVDVLAAALGTEPLLIIARTETDPRVSPMPVTSAGIPNDHFEYAMTWFLLAATWIVMTGFAVWRIKRRTR